MRFFVTGIGGFVGVHLAEHLLAAGHEVTGSVTGAVDRPRLAALAARHARFTPARLATLDVTDRAALEAALAAAAPDGVVHLAGIAFAPRAEADPARAFAVNVLGTMHVLEAVATKAPGRRVLVVGSADAYGAVTPEALPITEDVALQPVNVYGLSKATADMAAFRAWWAGGVPVVRARAFNHTGPGQAPDFVCSDFARQFARIEAGLAPAELRVGSLRATRDFTDVRDVVRGYHLLWERGTPGEAYNLCSGRGTTIAAVVDMLAAASGRTVKLIEEPGRVRRREVPVLIGSAARAGALGWRPEIQLAQTLRDLLDDWRRRVASGAA